MNPLRWVWKLLWPYHCYTCGRRRRRVRRADLTDRQWRQHVAAGTETLLTQCCYRCDKCDGPGEAVMIL
jgi:hypothetical protein